MFRFIRILIGFYTRRSFKKSEFLFEILNGAYKVNKICFEIPNSAREMNRIFFKLSIFSFTTLYHIIGYYKYSKLGVFKSP